VAFGNETYKLNLTNYNYKYNNYTRDLVGRSFSRCLRNRLLSGSSMRFTIRPFGRLLSGSSMRFTSRPFGCALRRALY
jgi:hypothetical protein